MSIRVPLLAAALLAVACSPRPEAKTSALPDGEAKTAAAPDPAAVKPLRATAPVAGDSDDPAIWFHPTDLAKSLILGTDKSGVLYTFDLSGAILADRTVN